MDHTDETRNLYKEIKQGQFLFHVDFNNFYSELLPTLGVLLPISFQKGE